MFCPQCGNSCPDGTTFCTVCGTKMKNPVPVEETTPVVEPVAEVVAPVEAPAPVQTAPARPARFELPKKYEPVSAWGFFFYQVLFMIPLIGQIFLIIFACGGARKKNLVNFARSYFCALLVLLIIVVLVSIAVLLISVVGGVGLGALFTGLLGMVQNGTIPV